MPLSAITALRGPFADIFSMSKSTTIVALKWALSGRSDLMSYKSKGHMLMYLGIMKSQFNNHAGSKLPYLNQTHY